MFVIQNVENFWAEMKVVTHRFIILKPFSFSTRAQDLKLIQTLCFFKKTVIGLSILLKIQLVFFFLIVS